MTDLILKMFKIQQILNKYQQYLFSAYGILNTVICSMESQIWCLPWMQGIKYVKKSHTHKK